MAELGYGDLVELILVRLDVKDLIRFKSVCKSWHSLIASPRFFLKVKFVRADVVWQILVRSDVKDLIRFKRVCKSWHSLITSPRFVNRHLNLSCNKDRCNNKLVHRRITCDHLVTCDQLVHLVGSSNGLVCMTLENYSKVVVVNPLTKEARQLSSLPSRLQACWGFGYDTFSDDYKVIAGAKKGYKQTCLQVLSLKSNVWRSIGEVKYRFYTKIGILCNGALHWLVVGQNFKTFILSYDLSKEEFEEILLPDDPTCICCSCKCYLGIVKECLCIFIRDDHGSSYYGYPYHDAWLMKKYNVKESWEMLPHWRDQETKRDIVHILRWVLTKKDDESWFFLASEHHYREYMDAPIFVPSLVSPYLNVRPKQASNNKRIAKVGFIFIYYVQIIDFSLTFVILSFIHLASIYFSSWYVFQVVTILTSSQ
ncbi:putative F-box domain, kelch-type beta propeller, F-box associated interaction [Helianthus debilis subsp. tardiflorus]